MKRLNAKNYEAMFQDAACAGVNVDLIEKNDVRLPKREAHGHKYSFGRALIIAGSEGFSGAPALAANACERSGAGLTQLVVPRSIYSIAAARCDGAVVRPLEADSSGTFSRSASDAVLPLLADANACLIGPGLGRTEGVRALVLNVIRDTSCPLILDADALTLVGASSLRLLDKSRAPLIVTPHEGEFQRIGGDLSSGRLNGASGFCGTHQNVVLVLKGHGTLVSRGKNHAANLTGTAALAKGGTGDVLAGVLCALLAQGIEPLEAARSAVYLHGLAGDLAEAETGPYSLPPSDVIRYLPKAFCSIQ